VLKANKIAVIGDLHGRYNSYDNNYLERAGFDLVLYVGDLGSGTLKNGLEMIRILSRVRVPGLVLPGNNDAEHLAELKAELTFQSGKSELLRLMGPSARKGVEPCGFSVHELTTNHGGVSLIAARPCAMGGSECSFAEQLSRNHQISTLLESEQKLRNLIDSTAHQDVIFFAHNGPYGLGGGASDLWSRDFKLNIHPDAPKDWGDSDLRSAIDYASSIGKRVIAVIAGHMHRSQSNARPLSVHLDGVLHINAAMVPRILMKGEAEEHHYVELNLDLRKIPAITVEERWVTLPLPQADSVAPQPG
jgi:uncharacterized protein (TIGR04168 family)